MYDINWLKEKRYRTVSIECYNLCEKHIRKNIYVPPLYEIYIIYNVS